jgi:hypothetical protein
MKTELFHLFRPNSAQWDSWIGRANADFYHMSAYHRFIEGMSGNQAWLAVYGSQDKFIAWPYLIRPIDGTDFFDGTSVYGYTGPVVANVMENDHVFINDAWKRILGTWKAQGLVTMFTCFHPILGNSALCESFKTGTSSSDEGLLTMGQSVSIDLAVNPDNRLAAYKKQFRQDLKRSIKLGLKVELDEQWNHFDSFVRLYRANMASLDADPRYWYSASELRQLIEALGSNCCLTVIRIEDEIAAALMIVICGDIAQAHLTGIDERFREYSPLKLLLHESANIASNLGAKVFHLGAGLGGVEDSLFRFKAQYSKCRHSFVVGRWVLDDEHYRVLNEQYANESDLSKTSGFFPRYRA